MHKYISIAVAAAALAVPATASAVPAGAATTTSNSLSYEFDNGDFTQQTHPWFYELQKNTAAMNVTTTDYGYADAGIVADLGLADNFTGITAITTGPTATNVWIGDGSDANTPGQYNSANFSYGFQQTNGSFYMTDGPHAGQTLTPAQIAGDFHGDEVYAWVGLVYAGTTVSGSVSSVNGQATGNRKISLTNNGDGTLTAAVH